MTPRPQRMPRAWVWRARPSWFQLSPCHRAKPSSATAPTGPSHIVSQPSTWLATLTPARAKTTVTVAASRTRRPRAMRASRRRVTASCEDRTTPSAGDAGTAAGLTSVWVIPSMIAGQPVENQCTACAWTPPATAATRSPSVAPALDETSDVLRLAEVLRRVVEHRDEADADRDGRVPPLVDDAGVTVRVEVLEEVHGARVHRRLVAGEVAG